MDDFKDSFLLALDSLREYLPDIVISGGWVPFVYYAYAAETRPSQEPLRTKDIDLLIPEKLRIGKRPSLNKILEREKFKPNEIGISLGSFGRKGPNEVKYEATKDGIEIEVTFLTPRLGKESRPAISIQGSVVATLLRYMDILLKCNMEVRILDQTSKGKKVDFKARVPIPAAYLYQKGLSFVDRPTRDKKAKDLYYFFDILANYAELRDECIKEIPKIQRGFPGKWYKRFKGNLNSHFESPESEGPVLVEEQRPGGGSSSEFRRTVFGTFQHFLKKI
ncbi:GSU2403 family nucleotidyltransferase fold protein [Elusimicrobiota bacterium]